MFVGLMQNICNRSILPDLQYSIFIVHTSEAIKLEIHILISRERERDCITFIIYNASRTFVYSNMCT